MTKAGPRYLDTLKMLSALFVHARKNGMVQLEEDVEHPEKSKLFLKFPLFLANHHAVNFVCGTLRMAISGNVLPNHENGLAFERLLRVPSERGHRAGAA